MVKKSIIILTIIAAALLISCGTESTPWSAADVCPDVPGTLLDERDGQSYKTVKIGTQTWMAENLNYATGNSWCYDDADSNCVIYGRRYDWPTANTACPVGWHLPDDVEWQVLVDNMGGTSEAGQRLKTSIGWDNKGYVDNSNGSDDCGFSAFPGGGGAPNGDIDLIGNRGYWWTSTQYNEYWARVRIISSYYDDVSKYSAHLSVEGFSIRCVLD